MAFLTVVPAYGRDYKNKASAEKDWTDGKDFMIANVGHRYNGSYCSINNANSLKGEGFKGVGIRYKRLEMQTFVNF